MVTKLDKEFNHFLDAERSFREYAKSLLVEALENNNNTIILSSNILVHDCTGYSALISQLHLGADGNIEIIGEDDYYVNFLSCLNSTEEIYNLAKKALKSI